jgi:hypothetical protein
MATRTNIKNDNIFILDNEIYGASVMPSVRTEMSRNVEIIGDVEVLGGIFGKSISVKANNVYVKGPVHASDSILIKCINKGSIWFNSVVNAEHSIIVEQDLESYVRFSNTISSQMININHAVIYGNIFCKEIIIRNSIVLGGIYCEKKLTVDNSIIGTYSTSMLNQVGPFALFLPFAASNLKPEIGFPVFNLLPMNLNEVSENGIYEMNPEEIYPVFEGVEKKYILSSSLRIFDLRKYYDIMLKNLERLLYITNSDFESKNDFDKKLKVFDGKLTNFIEKRFSIEPVLPKSDFMEIEDSIITEYFQNIKSESADLSDEDIKNSEDKNSNGFGEDDQSIPTDEGISQENGEEEHPDNEYNFNDNDKTDHFADDEYIYKCNHCGEAIISEDLKYCTKCGYELGDIESQSTTDVKVCPKCFRIYSSEEEKAYSYCLTCGTFLTYGDKHE